MPNVLDIPSRPRTHCVFCVTWHKYNVAETLLSTGRIFNVGDCSRMDTSSREAFNSLGSPSCSFLWTRSSRPSALFTWRGALGVRRFFCCFFFFCQEKPPAYVVEAELFHWGRDEADEAVQGSAPQHVYKLGHTFGYHTGAQPVLQQELSIKKTPTSHINYWIYN